MLYLFGINKLVHPMRTSPWRPSFPTLSVRMLTLQGELTAYWSMPTLLSLGKLRQEEPVGLRLAWATQGDSQRAGSKFSNSSVSLGVFKEVGEADSD